MKGRGRERGRKGNVSWEKNEIPGLPSTKGYSTRLKTEMQHTKWAGILVALHVLPPLKTLLECLFSTYCALVNVGDLSDHMDTSPTSWTSLQLFYFPNTLLPLVI